jgi:hypothetical protein
MILTKKNPAIADVWLFLLLSVAIQTGCTTTASLNSAAPPSLIIDPLSSDDIEVDYSRASVDVRKTSVAGFMSDLTPQDATEVAILDFQNGSQRGTMNARGINLLVGFTGIANWVSASLMMQGFLGTNENSALENPVAVSAIIGIPIAMYVNERIWQWANSKRLRAFGQQELMESDQADFYCLPNEKISFTRKLFGTDWTYSGNMLAGRYSILPAADSGQTNAAQQARKNRQTEAKPQSNGEKGILSEQTLKSKTRLDESAAEICYVMFKRQWIKGVLEENGATEGGNEWFKVTFEYDGKLKTKLFNARAFSYNAGLILLDRVKLEESYGAEEGVVIEIVQSPQGKLAKVEYSVEGELKNATVPAYLLKKVN